MKPLRGLAVALALVVISCGGTPAAPGSAAPSGAGAPAGSVVFLSSQGNAVNEAEGIRRQVLTGFNGSVDFNSSLSDSDIVTKVKAEHQAGKASIDLVAGLHGDFPTLLAENALEDLSPLMQRLQKDRHFNATLVNYGRLGTDKQYYIPWIQATYLMVANKKALQYLPKGADLNNLSYDQLISWGQAMQQATGEKKIGLPAGPKGLIHRGLQGYWYPSYTGGEVTGFKSPEAVTMWQTYRKLWAVTNAQSTNYGFMQEPLQSGEVWVAWDHQARLIDALKNAPDQFVTFPAPSGPKGLGYMSVVAGLAIPKGAGNRKGAEALIDYLTRASSQTKTTAVLGFFPVLSDVSVGGSDAPPGVGAEAAAAAKQTASKKGIPALLPVGLGKNDAQFNKAYTDSFTRIILRGEDIQTVLNDEAAQMQQLLAAGSTPCWPPDTVAGGTCQIR